jgi:hypothetical protein
MYIHTHRFHKPEYSLGLALGQDTDLSESEEVFESEFHIKYGKKEDEKKAGNNH